MKRMSPDIDASEMERIVDELAPASGFSRGDLLVRQGDVARECYFVLQGCLRLFSVDGEGRETTADFITEEQTAVIFESFKQGKPSPYSLECLEDSIVLHGDLHSETEMYERFPALKELTRRAIEEQLASRLEAHATFKAASPEQRYLDLLDERPGLPTRVAQHQLASYLGVTPESLSRIKRRVKRAG
jgi:CRP-like cAMP-binding protein